MNQHSVKIYKKNRTGHSLLNDRSEDLKQENMLLMTRDTELFGQIDLDGYHKTV